MRGHVRVVDTGPAQQRVGRCLARERLGECAADGHVHRPDDDVVQARGFLREPLAPRFELPPALVGNEPELAADGCQAQVRVVLAQAQAELGAAREHAIRLGRAARDEIVDQHADVGFLAARIPRLALAHASSPR